MDDGGEVKRRDHAEKNEQNDLRLCHLTDIKPRPSWLSATINQIMPDQDAE